MPILKPIDENYTCVDATTPDDILRSFALGFNSIVYIETDIAGSQLQNLDPYSFFCG